MPRKYFVTRHRGAVTWAAREGSGVRARRVETENFDPQVVKPGDVVMGTLPVHLAAEVNAQGGLYWHLVMDVPPEFRGKELSADEMDAFGARLEEFVVRSSGPRLSESPDDWEESDHMADVHVCIATGQTLANVLPLMATQWRSALILCSEPMKDRGKLLKVLAEDIAKGRGVTGGVHLAELPDSLDWPSLQKYALDLARKLKFVGRVDFNLSGGTKPMTLAFHGAFDAFARLIYCSVDNDKLKRSELEVLNTVSRAPVELPRSLLSDFSFYLLANGYAVGRSTPCDEAGVVARSFMTNSLIHDLDRLFQATIRLSAELSDGVQWSRPVADEGNYSNPLSFFHHVANEALPKRRARKQIEPFRRHVKICGDGGQIDSIAALIGAYKSAGVIVNVNESTIASPSVRKEVEFDFSSESSAAYVGGGYLEEYVMLCLDDIDTPCESKAGNVGLRRFTGKVQEAELNELDAVAVSRNRLLLIECKAGNQFGTGGDQNIINKLALLRETAGGSKASALLVLSRKVDPQNETTLDRIKANRIQTVAGQEELKTLAQSLARMLGAELKDKKERRTGLGAPHVPLLRSQKSKPNSLRKPQSQGSVKNRRR